MQKRGQAAIFIILAIVLLLLGFIYFYSQNLEERTIDISNPQAASAKNFIETCIEQVSDKAFRIAGINGGYITFPDEITSDQRSYLQNGPLAEVRTPYWWFEGKEQVPTEEFIAKQVEDYIKANLDACIDELSALQYIRFKKLDPMQVNVQLNAQDVTIHVNYPLQLDIGENKSRINFEQFSVNLPIRFKHIYSMARDILDAENRDQFLERRTIDLITMDKEIPTTDIEVTCQEKTWLLSNIERKLKRLLTTNLAYINVEGSSYDTNIFVPNPFGEDTYANSYFNSHYTWKISDKDYEDMKVAFEYNQKWPMKLYARPSQNGILRAKPQPSQDILKFFCLHIWHFTYDVVYPVKVTIRDTNGVDPYQFSFAFMVSIDHNNPKRESLAFSLFDALEEGNQDLFCSDRVNEMTIYTVENGTNAIDVPDVNLSFVCGVYSCPIAKTQWLSFGAAAGTVERFPFCNNGVLKASKEGYLDRSMIVQTERPASVTLYMTPIKKLPIEVVKHSNNEQKPLEPSDIVTISLKSKDGSFSSYATYPEEMPLTLLADDHTYVVSLTLSDGVVVDGGYEAQWQISRDALQSATKITFHVIEHQGSEDEFIDFFQNLKEHSKNIPTPQITGEVQFD